jgi:uncharacterized protein YjdB
MSVLAVCTFLFRGNFFHNSLINLFTSPSPNMEMNNLIPKIGSLDVPLLSLQQQQMPSLQTFQQVEVPDSQQSSLSYHHQQAYEQQQQQQHHQHLLQNEQDPISSSQHVANHMQVAVGIVQRFNEWGGGALLLPAKEREQAEEDQENRDALQLTSWKQAFVAKKLSSCPIEVVNFLDKEIPGWKEINHKGLSSSAMQKAQGIVTRYLARGKVLPRDLVGAVVVCITDIFSS